MRRSTWRGGAPSPRALAPIQTRLDDVMQRRNPSDPYADRPELGQQLRAALKG